MDKPAIERSEGKIPKEAPFISLPHLKLSSRIYNPNISIRFITNFSAILVSNSLSWINDILFQSYCVNLKKLYLHF